MLSSLGLYLPKLGQHQSCGVRAAATEAGSEHGCDEAVDSFRIPAHEKGNRLPRLLPTPQATASAHAAPARMARGFAPSRIKACAGMSPTCTPVQVLRFMVLRDPFCKIARSVPVNCATLAGWVFHLAADVSLLPATCLPCKQALQNAVASKHSKMLWQQLLMMG